MKVPKEDTNDNILGSNLMSKTIYPTPYHKSSISEMEDGGSPQELSEIFLKNQRFTITDSQTPHNKRTYLDATYQPIERRGERLNSKKILENSLQGEGRVGNKRLSIKYRNIEELARDRIREEQIEDINDNDSNYEGALVFDKIKEKSNFPSDIIISNSATEYNLSPTKDYKVSDYPSIGDFGESTIRYSGKTKPKGFNDIKQKIFTLDGGDEDRSDVRVEFIDEKDNINNKIDDVYLIARSRSKSLSGNTSRQGDHNIEDRSRIDGTQFQNGLNQIKIKKTNSYSNDPSKIIHLSDLNNPLVSSSRGKHNSSVLSFSTEKEVNDSIKSAKSNITISDGNEQEIKTPMLDKYNDLSLISNRGDISKTDVIVKDDMIIPKTYRTGGTSGVFGSTVKPTLLIPRQNDTDSFIKINEESIYDYSLAFDGDNGNLNNGKNLIISDQSSSSSGFEELSREDIDISDSDKEYSDDREIISKLFKQNDLDMVLPT
jgi:hypothetical protein